jgi:hypothetical protein
MTTTGAVRGFGLLAFEGPRRFTAACVERIGCVDLTFCGVDRVELLGTVPMLLETDTERDLDRVPNATPEVVSGRVELLGRGGAMLTVVGVQIG